jgi:hypothetical protein
LKTQCEACQEKKTVADLIDKEHQIESGQRVQIRLQCMYDQIEARHANAGAHHANLKPGQWQSICDHYRFLYANMASEITRSNTRACLLVI